MMCVSLFVKGPRDVSQSIRMGSVCVACVCACCLRIRVCVCMGSVCCVCYGVCVGACGGKEESAMVNCFAGRNHAPFLHTHKDKQHSKTHTYLGNQRLILRLLRDGSQHTHPPTHIPCLYNNHVRTRSISALFVACCGTALSTPPCVHARKALTRACQRSCSGGMGANCVVCVCVCDGE